MKRAKIWLWTGLLAVLSASVLLSAVNKPFPAHWGEPPKIQTRDYVRLPGGYGHGSSTLGRWIEANLQKDREQGAGSGDAPVQPLYTNDFSQTEVGQVPEDFLVLNGAFAVREVDGNKVLEAPGAPVDDYAVLFGPTEQEDVSVRARIFGTRHGRRYPVLAVGLNGLGGYELQLAPAKRALELFKGEERIASVPARWESGTWTRLRLQVRKVGEGWKVQGKAWKDGSPEPEAWTLTYDEAERPPAGRALISGHPYSGTPIQFDDLVVSRAKGS